MAFSELQKKEICATITSLYFLSKESHKNELQEISIILLRAIKAIDDYVETKKQTPINKADDDVFEVIEFFEDLMNMKRPNSIN